MTEDPIPRDVPAWRAKVYTRTGDDGTTGLQGGARIEKSAPQVQAYGTLDELNATLGMVRSHDLPLSESELLAEVQADLFVLGTEASCPPDRKPAVLLGSERVKAIEDAIDHYQEQLPALQNFILPGGAPAGASLHLARTVCRRAERDIEAWGGARAEVLRYLNRLSDLLFVLARFVNHEMQAPEVVWEA